MELVPEAAATPLKLHVRVYNDAMARHSQRRGSAHSILVRVHPNTPFKNLTDKLRQKYGDHTMALDESPSFYIFDSDTPASVSASCQDAAELSIDDICD
jgi:hypothetical protein